MVDDHSPARPGSGPRNGLDSEHHTTAVLKRILAEARDGELHMMALLKTILADATVQAVLPIEDTRAYHRTLASHAADLNGPACRFPNCACAPIACRANQHPA